MLVGLLLPWLFACGEKAEERMEGTEVGDCTDRADNDGDGLFDCDDGGCAGSPDCVGGVDTGDPIDTNDTTDTSTSPTQDDDGDGFTENQGDCDDSDASVFPGFPDISVDGVDQDCDDLDGPDLDGDGYADATVGGDDCDDNDATVPRYDADCDGVVTAEDCDDTDASMPMQDMDCDGVLTLHDCDDTDSSTVHDMDCDGVVTAEDCDDTDANSTTVATDGDCDGVLTLHDCDDGDANISPNAFDIPNDGIDQDCDGVDSVLICGLTDCDMNLDLGGGQSLDFVLVPAGIFLMGSPSGELGRVSDENQHQVTLTHDFYAMTTEVTQGMFYQLMGYEAYDGYSTNYGSGTDYPAYYVSWHMGAAYANAVTQHHNSIHGTALGECYTCSGTDTSVVCTESVNPYTCTGYRLLTEAEWEYTARAGDSAAIWTPIGSGELPSGYNSATQTLTNGFDLQQYAWYSANDDSSAHIVAQKISNDYGVYDMSGNVFEWVHDYYGSYTTGTVVDPVTTVGSLRGARGGYWYTGPSYLRSAFRYYANPTDRYYSLGFRLGCTP